MKKAIALIFALVLNLGIMAQKYEIVSETLSSDNKYNALVINYESVDVDMVTPVTVSGLIMIPISGIADCYLIDQHFTCTDNASAPSVYKGSTSFGSSITSRYVVIMTDFIGYGVTIDRAHPYMCNSHSAQNSIDLARIARKIVAERGIHIKADLTFISGYSQGGSVAFCAHRLLDMNPEMAEELHFAGSFCGGGAYDLPMVTKWYLESEKSKEMSMAYLMIYAASGLLEGMPQYFKPGRQLSEFCSDRINRSNAIKLMKEKKTNCIELSIRVQLMCGGSTNVKDYVSPDVVKSDSELRKELDAASAANTFLDDWKPTTPLVLYHVIQDDVICIDNAYSAIQRLGMKRSDHMIINQPGGSHLMGLMNYYNQLPSLITNRINEYITGINEVRNSDVNESKCYDLNGRQVDGNYRGIIIKDGKKLVQH